MAEKTLGTFGTNVPYLLRLNDMGFGKYNGFRGFEEFLQNSIG
jgi:hypothetical protein